MSSNLDPHAPDIGFVRRLERDVIAAYRDEPPAAPARRRSMHPAWLRTAAIVVLSLVAGAAAGVGSAQVQETQQKARLLSAARAELVVAEKRVELARVAAEEAQRRHQAGVASAGAIAAAESELREMRARLKEIELNIEEIQLTAMAPRRDLGAPLVDGRDFVRDRIEVDLSLAQERLVAAEAALEEAERRHDVGIVPRQRLLEAEGGVASARADFEVLLARAQLRQAAVERTMSTRELAERAARLEIAARLRMSERLRELAAQQVEEARSRAAVGSIEEVDRLRAELELAERQVEIERLRAQLEALSQRPE